MKYVAVARLRCMGMLMYDRDIVVRTMFMVVVLITFVELWTTTYAVTNQTSIAGFSVPDLVWYLVITEVVTLSTPRVGQMIDTDVRSGDVAYAIARPYSYPLYYLAMFWGESIVRLPLNALAGAAVAFVAVGPPPVSGPALLGTVVLTVGAITLRGILDVLIGLSAFWVEDTQPAEWILSKFIITVGGLLLPLELFPEWLADISRALPFASLAYAPARAFVGTSFGEFATLFVSQVVWLVVFWVTLVVVFGHASRRLAAHGG